MFKSLFYWKVFLNIIVAAGIFLGLVWLTFRWLEFHTNHGKEVEVPNVMNKSVHEAIKILDDAGLEYEVDSLQYDPKFKPYQVLKVWPYPGSHVKDGRSIEIRVNPKTWAPVAVPDILDRYKGLAFRQLDRVGLKVGDTLFEPSIQRDAVIRMSYNGQDLKPGTLLPRFASIDLVIGAGPKRNIPVPNVVGLTIAEAKAIIKQNLFEIGLIEYEDGRKDESDIVYYQDPGAMSTRDQGMQIDLWASKKTPAEMHAKIKQLNAIYRMKVDTTLPPVRYDEVIQDAPSPEVAPVPATSSTVSPETVKPATKPDVKPEAPKNVTGPTTTKPKSEEPKVEKPKARKVIVE
ncbi:MAG: PASTA domain-containing protein [Bacteroidetes bacterium]|nr:PASTA domain-containing protein [Bacteroidota bacterium]